ncbi:DEAD/DEAH box helicase family protein [Candidatus Poribacteria bacterium]|nr:DEAD/DEAH box helicase family protein [Candidatus Poribacteria bacterium]
MRQVVIENPVINSPFKEPQRHFKFDEQGITNEIVSKRRNSAYFIPIPKPKRRGKQEQLELDLQGEWTGDRLQENKFINDVRERVAIWRRGGYVGITPTTRHLLEYWAAPDREKKFFFCQLEAAETAIYLTEVADKYGDNWIKNRLREANEMANPLLFRIAFKMATGAGKTGVMAMLIAWHTLNKIANPQRREFSDAFLIVTPGLTIRDRLRVLLPNDPQNAYDGRDILPPDYRQELGKAKIIVTNFHAFMLRTKTHASKLTQSILNQGEPRAFTETPSQMVRRVCRELGNKKNIIVINDEAHHCYRRKPDDVKLKGDERKEAEKRNEDARVWISGLEAVKEKIGVKVVYDLSATPFFLQGSGYSQITPDGKKITEGVLFPWVVSDFSLIDAIESGIVKVPRVPVDDNSMIGEQPTYRNLWLRIRDELPKRGRSRKNDAENNEAPRLPAELQGALNSLYGNYEKYYRRWEANPKRQTPPVMIIVCNNTSVSKLVYDWVAGWEKQRPDGQMVVVPGQLPIFSNEENGGWLPRPNTILIDSEQLESGEAMSRAFKQIAHGEIEQFKADYQRRFPGRSVEKITDEDLLREVMNTVGKPDKLGEQIKCVVSVSMLTEGWDANTVTHILGVRAFGTQLLCEQVVGRGLRRASYETEPLRLDVNGKTVEFEAFPPEYAEVYGIPFSFIPSAGTTKIQPRRTFTHVRALEERIDCEITFPRLTGYRYHLAAEKISAAFDDDSHYALSTIETPTKTVTASILGEANAHYLTYRDHRIQEVEFYLTRVTLETYFRDEMGNEKPWLFPQLLEIVRLWMKACVTYKDNTYPQMFMIEQYAHAAAHRIYQAVVKAEHAKGKSKEKPPLMPILRPYESVGLTRYVAFDTARPVYPTAPKKCHISHVVADTESWEQKTAQSLEEMDEIIYYVKNHNLGFTIPYIGYERTRHYIPDFIVKIDRGNGDPLNLILEVTGRRDEDKATKVSTARNLWTPAVNNHGGFGRWAFLEISDPWDVQNTIRAFLNQL